MGGCPPDGSDMIDALITWPFTLTGLDDPRLVLCNNNLCDPTVDPVGGDLYNPRNGHPSLIQPDSFTDLGGRNYLVVSAGRDCNVGWQLLTPQLFETSDESALDTTSPDLSSVSTLTSRRVSPNSLDTRTMRSFRRGEAAAGHERSVLDAPCPGD